MRRTAAARERAQREMIAAAEAASEDDRIAEAVVSSPGERMERGIALGGQLPCAPGVLAEIDARADGQSELARRRIALGIGRRARP